MNQIQIIHLEIEVEWSVKLITQGWNSMEDLGKNVNISQSMFFCFQSFRIYMYDP